MIHKNQISIADVPRELCSLIQDKAAVPSYRQLYAEVLNGSIPAERIKGRWYVNGLKPVIQHFGLVERVSG
jgi:hypothetical protein